MSPNSHNLVEPSSELGVSLLICRGRTESRVRPVNTEKFLIGSGPSCDLLLAGDQIPTLHSILHVNGADVWIEAMTGDSLNVNRFPVESCLLRNGDRVEIGPFEFQLRIEAPKQQTQAVRAPHFDRNALASQATLQNLSAEQLVDALDHELQLIEQFSSRRQLGADALMRAIQARRQQIPMSSSSEFLSPHDEVLEQKQPQPASSASADQVFDRIHSALRQLEQRSAGLEQREEAYAEAAATLLEVQERFAEQLEAIQQHLGEWQMTTAPRRASA